MYNVMHTVQRIQSLFGICMHINHLIKTQFLQHCLVLQDLLMPPSFILTFKLNLPALGINLLLLASSQ